MKVHRYAVVFVAAIMLLLPSAVSAQTATPTLPVGKWTGTVTPPDGETAAVTFDVKSSNDTIAIQINAGDHGTFETSDVKLAGTKLTFSFTPGPRVLCELEKKEDGSFAGHCAEDNGKVALITMVPPKEGGA